MTTTYPPTYSCTTSTPWGRAQYAAKYAPGIICYSTAGHGGFHLSSTRNAQVHPAWRSLDGWYEEDCQWAVVAITFPAAFPGDAVAEAHQSAKRWMPHEYMAALGVEVSPEESYILQVEAFHAEHKNDLLAIVAYGDWADWVPEGKVRVGACIAGREGTGKVERYFLVDAERYDSHGKFSYVIDPSVDVECEGEK